MAPRASALRIQTAHRTNAARSELPEELHIPGPFIFRATEKDADVCELMQTRPP